MGGASTLDPDNFPDPQPSPPGRDNRALGPSDLADSGSDTIGQPPHALSSDTDSTMTGESVDVGGTVDPDTDLGADQVVAPADAGLGSDDDEAEQAQHDKRSDNRASLDDKPN